jgi:thiol-disulfide isomerase/thioredoxin
MRQMNKTRYIVAAAITIGIFLLGLMLGFVVEGKRLTYVQDLLQQERSEFSSSQLQYSYVSTLNSQDACPAIYSIFYNNLRNLDATATRLETYAKDSRINDASFIDLKRDYTIEQLRYWLLSKQARDVCKEDLVRVLYFFSTDTECPDCANQAFVLDYLKHKYGDKVLIFSIDANFEQEPMISILKQQYNISKYPTLIVENQKIDGFSSREDLETNLCGLFQTSTPGCPG